MASKTVITVSVTKPCLRCSKEKRIIRGVLYCVECMEAGDTAVRCVGCGAGVGCCVRECDGFVCADCLWTYSEEKAHRDAQEQADAKKQKTTKRKTVKRRRRQ